MARSTKDEQRKENSWSHQYRCSMYSLFEVFRNTTFTAKHKKVMAKTPFKILFEALSEDRVVKSKKSNELFSWIISCYDSTKEGFNFGEVFAVVHKSDVQLIFGIRDGNEKIVIPENQNRKNKNRPRDFMDRLFDKCERPTSRTVKDKLIIIAKQKDKQSIEDTVRLLCLLLIASCLLTTSGSVLTLNHVKYIDNLEQMARYDWSGEILTALHKSLNKWYTEPQKVTGCTLLLMYWFCEHYIPFSPNKLRTTETQDELFPRCTRWDFTKLPETFTSTTMKNLKKEEIILGELEPCMWESIDLFCFPSDDSLEGAHIVEETSKESGEADSNKNNEEKIDDAEEYCQIDMNQGRQSTGEVNHNEQPNDDGQLVVHTREDDATEIVGKDVKKRLQPTKEKIRAKKLKATTAEGESKHESDESNNTETCYVQPRMPPASLTLSIEMEQAKGNESSNSESSFEKLWDESINLNKEMHNLQKKLSSSIQKKLSSSKRQVETLTTEVAELKTKLEEKDTLLSAAELKIKELEGMLYQIEASIMMDVVNSMGPDEKEVAYKIA